MSKDKEFSISEINYMKEYIPVFKVKEKTLSGCYVGIGKCPECNKLIKTLISNAFIESIIKVKSYNK